MRNIKEIAFNLYNAMNVLDCGCTENFEDSVCLGEGDRIAEFEEIEGTDKFRLYVFERGNNNALYTLTVGYAEVSDLDQATVDMFEKMLDENQL